MLSAGGASMRRRLRGPVRGGLYDFFMFPQRVLITHRFEMEAFSGYAKH
jgi:hypothetical protein